MADRRLFSLDEILEKPILVSKNKQVRIYGIESGIRNIDLKGYVRSDSRGDYFHKVEKDSMASSSMLPPITISSFEIFL